MTRTGPARDVRFRGTRGPTASSPAMVMVQDAASGETLGLLEHRVRYSPTGLNWGYNGSGPRDLARSLLAAVLAEEALCSRCRGAAPSCRWCRDGLRPDLPAAAFTTEVIAHLPPEWSLAPQEVRLWWDQHHRNNGDEAAASTPRPSVGDLGGRE